MVSLYLQDSKIFKLEQVEAVAKPSNSITLGAIEPWTKNNGHSEKGAKGTVSNVVPELRNLDRVKRNTALPSDAHKIAIHNMRHVDFYGSSDGAYKVSQHTKGVTRIPGINGKVITATISDGHFQQKYNVYFTMKTNNGLEYYALKDGENVAQKISGLPYDAILMCVHNMENYIFFGTSDGAYELQQGTLNARKVPDVSGKVVRIEAHGKGKYNVTFETEKPTQNSNSKLKSEIDRLQVILDKCSLEKKELEDKLAKNAKLLQNFNLFRKFDLL